MTVAENTCEFGASPLRGVVTTPQSPDELGVVLLNAGLVHRVGPNRLHVALARRLAEAGHVVLRFDHAGIGDSPPRTDGRPFEEAAPREVSEAIDHLERTTPARRFVLAGICSGAMMALRAGSRDARVVAVLPVNPQSHLEDPELAAWIASRKEARYLFAVSMTKGKSWKSALTGKVDYLSIARTVFRRATGFLRRPKPLSLTGWDPLGDLRSLSARGARTHLVFSRGDASQDLITAVTGRELPRLERTGSVTKTVVEGADHTFTPMRARARLLDLLCGRIATIAGSDTR